jgi:hypothetical protein
VGYSHETYRWTAEESILRVGCLSLMYRDSKVGNMEGCVCVRIVK